jgi:predicted ATPase
VWFVEFALLADPHLVPRVATASAPGSALAAARRRAGALVRDRKPLLILDNCEHLHALEPASNLTRLPAGQDPRIVAGFLRIVGETIFRPALPFPEAGRALSPDALARYAAVRLFLERAAAVRPDFWLTERNAVAVNEICRRLDGIPLAIELAAARLRALSAEKIAEHLDDRFRLLTSGARTALPRQTLRALID